MLNKDIITMLDQGSYNDTFKRIYCTDIIGAEQQIERYKGVIHEFTSLFGDMTDVELFSAPGRTEIGGNHTDHQHGRVLAAGINLDVIAAAAPNNENIIRIKSYGYEMDVINLDNLDINPAETNKSASLIRGIAARIKKLGFNIGGFNAYTTSNVLKGSGLSSSAAFEVLVGTILNHLFNDGRITPVQVAQVGQYAENNYFGKPSGLMDQTASSVGGFVTIDFKDPANPVVEKVDFDFASSGYSLCIVDTGGSHADLTDDYAACTGEMLSIASALGQKYLRQVDEQDFFKNISKLRSECGDRAVLRAIHFFEDNDRVPMQVKALSDSDFETFKKLIIESGYSSYMYLQNVFSTKAPQEQGVSLALAISHRLLSGQGAWRVHGGGFAGTIQAFVPDSMLDEYKSAMEAVFGEGNCHVLSVRPVGGIKVETK